VVTGDDVAKRLADYGFHAPTMSSRWRNADGQTTESESRTGSTRLRGEDPIAARSIRIGAGTWPFDDKPLRGAPLTAEAEVGRLGSSLHPRGGRLPLGKGFRPSPWVAAGAPHRRALRRPQPGVLVTTRRGVRVIAADCVVCAANAIAARNKRQQSAARAG